MLTQEQLSILEDDFSEDILIDAKAGSGKTTILRLMADSMPDKRFLYLVFNKKNRQEARSLFPVNTVVHTMNSLCYKLSGIKGVKDSLSISDLQKIFPEREREELFEIKNHIESSSGNESSDWVERTYLAMEKGTVPFTHWGIVKKVVGMIGAETPEYFRQFDFILVDEAQDIDPYFYRLINRFDGRKIFVGDVFQSIYQFRGTMNVFRVHEGKRKTLSRTFRFGEEIAKFVNGFMTAADRNFTPIVPNSVVQSFVVDSVENEKFAYLFRTNANLFLKASEYAVRGKNISIPFDFDFMKRMVFDVFYLRSDMKWRIESPVVKSFCSYEQFSSVASYDPELSFAQKVVEELGIDIFPRMKAVERKMCAPRYADVVFLTAHKSKGLEFDSIKIADDFIVDLSKSEEVNILYVASTRAKYLLDVSGISPKL